MILVIECVVLCVIFTLIILPAQYKDPMVMIMSYPPNVIKRIEQLPQYAGCIKQKEKKHISKKIFGLFFLPFYWQSWRISQVVESLLIHFFMYLCSFL